MPVGSFATDESPFGVADLAGGVQTWLLNAAQVPHRYLCCQRGGSWTLPERNARAALRQGYPQTNVLRSIGFRLAVRPMNQARLPSVAT